MLKEKAHINILYEHYTSLYSQMGISVSLSEKVMRNIVGVWHIVKFDFV